MRENFTQEYLNDWRKNENANSIISIGAMRSYVADKDMALYTLEKLPEDIRDLHNKGYVHLHDLGMGITLYCMGHSLQDLILKGLWNGKIGTIRSRPAKHFDALLGQIMNFFFLLQTESAGAQSFSNFDTFLSPYVYYDKLSYNEVKQALQNFIYSLNQPLRAGSQCLSEDTEILTPNGWKKYNEINVGDTIWTFNLETQSLELKTVTYIYRNHYSGKMFNLKNRIQNQLISPHHRVVRKLFSTNKPVFILEPIEKVLSLKSPFIIPINAYNNNKDIELSDDWIKLLAWIIAEGSFDASHRAYRISITQSEIVNKDKFNEIKSILDRLHLDYTITKPRIGLGKPCRSFRLHANSTRKVMKFFDNENIHTIPKVLLNMSKRQSRLFLDTYNKADGTKEFKITTTSKDILSGLQQICVMAGYGFTTRRRRRFSPISKKPQYLLRIIKHQDTYINKVDKVKYDGIIWSVHTENETVIAKRDGSVFITGNTPFTNLTLDGYNKDLDDTIVVYAGKYLKDKTYKDFKKERLMIFKAFTEILTEGDGMGQTFTFPIPTINISKDFDFNSELFDLVLENTKKYGNFYFANYVNSVLDPTDARSLCCRLRLSIKDLHKHHHSTGGLFGSSEKTGSVAVSTINLPLLAYESNSEAEFFQKLDNIMEKMGEYHKIKREIVEDTIEKGLTPYIAYYYGDVKKRYGSYTANHFSTIGMLGMEETIKNLFGKQYNMFTHKEFAQKVLDFMLDKELELQEKYGFLFNLEETPAEGASYRLAMKAKELHPDIITADEETPYFTNGVLPHVSSTNNPFKLADNQDQLVSKFTSGSVVHFFLDEAPSINSLRAFIKTIIERTDIPYFTITPTFGICPIHGYIPGNFDYCPYCEAESNEDNENSPEFIIGV